MRAGGGVIPAAFSPITVANNKAWYRADLGASVSAWLDQSGTGDANKNAAQAVGAIQPSLAASAAFNNQQTFTFTGSDTTGAKVYETAAKSLKRVSLELGGKSPNIVFEDADLTAAAAGAISGIFAATGQTCIAGSRLLVHRSIHDRFVARFVERAAALSMGIPTVGAR